MGQGSGMMSHGLKKGPGSWWGARAEPDDIESNRTISLQKEQVLKGVKSLISQGGELNDGVVPESRQFVRLE